MRQFKSGASRDTDDGKIDYAGILSPLFLVRYGEFMRKHRRQPDGKLRDFDNWKLGIPIEEYPKSGSRHFVDWLLELEGFKGRDDVDIEEVCCAIVFNAQGFVHEKIKREGNVRNKATMEDLVRRSMITRSPRLCWAASLKGDAKTYLEMIEKECEKDPENPPVYARVGDILKEEFGVKTSRSALIKHLRKDCRCGQPITRRRSVKK